VIIEQSASTDSTPPVDPPLNVTRLGSQTALEVLAVLLDVATLYAHARTGQFDVWSELASRKDVSTASRDAFDGIIKLVQRFQGN